MRDSRKKAARPATAPALRATTGGTRKKTSASRGTGASAARRRTGATTPTDQLPGILEQLERIERDGGDGILVFAPGQTLAVSSLDRPVWPREEITKGALMRYYVRVAPALLPALLDRPLTLKRYPAGAAGPSFYQHDPGESAPALVRVEEVMTDEGTVPRFIGGDLATLLYTIQLGAIAVNPWHSRVQSLDTPDYVVLDLDPGPRVPFTRTLKVALHVGEVLDELGLRCALKTSGSRGIHLVVPVPARTDYDTAAALAEDVATRVATDWAGIATVERALGERPKGTVYVDHMQNARGKTLASVWSARARPGAPVSTPITWTEIHRGLDPQAFSVLTVPDLLSRRRRHWDTPLREGNPAAVVKAAVKQGRRTS